MYYRRLPQFDYLAPNSVDEMLLMLREHGRDARIIGGGTIVLNNLKERIGVKKVLIGLRSLPDMDNIIFDPSDGLRVGAMATLQDVADAPDVKRYFPILANACGRLGTPQIRNMGTIGGNVACKLPEAETVPVLISLGAKVNLLGSDGERIVALENVNKELKRGELLSVISIPKPSSTAKGGYERYTVRAGIDYATVSAAVLATTKNGVCENIRIALGGVSSKRSQEAESVIKGEKISDSVIAEMCRVAAENAKTKSDLTCSAGYKKELLKVMLERAFRQAQ